MDTATRQMSGQSACFYTNSSPARSAHAPVCPCARVPMRTCTLPSCEGHDAHAHADDTCLRLHVPSTSTPVHATVPPWQLPFAPSGALLGNVRRMDLYRRIKRDSPRFPDARFNEVPCTCTCTCAMHRASQTRASTRCRRALPYRMCTSLHPVPTRVAPIVLATRHARCAKGQRPRSCQQAYYRSGRTSGRISSRCAPRASTAVSIGRRSTGWQCRHRFCRSATPTCLHHSEPQSNNRRSTPIRVSNGSQESWVTGFDIGVLGTDDAAHVPQDVKERLHSCAKANI